MAQPKNIFVAYIDLKDSTGRHCDLIITNPASADTVFTLDTFTNFILTINPDTKLQFCSSTDTIPVNNPWELLQDSTPNYWYIHYGADKKCFWINFVDRNGIDIIDSITHTNGLSATNADFSKCSYIGFCNPPNNDRIQGYTRKKYEFLILRKEE